MNSNVHSMRKGLWLAALLLLLTLKAPAAEHSAQAAPPELLHFVQITDAHLGATDTNNEARLDAIVNEINRLPMPIAFVAVTGDITDDRTLIPEETAAARARFARLEHPVYFLPGNHDIHAQDANTWAQAYIDAFGPLLQSFDASGVRFLLAFTDSFACGYEIDGHDPLAWIEQQLADAGETPVILLHHIPATDNLFNAVLHPSRWPDARRAEWNRLINTHSDTLIAVIAGHFHRSELHNDQAVPLIVAPPAAGRYGRQASYRVYTVDPQHRTISYSTQYIEPHQLEPTP